MTRSESWSIFLNFGAMTILLRLSEKQHLSFKYNINLYPFLINQNILKYNFEVLEQDSVIMVKLEGVSLT